MYGTSDCCRQTKAARSRGGGRYRHVCPLFDEGGLASLRNSLLRPMLYPRVTVSRYQRVSASGEKSEDGASKSKGCILVPPVGLGSVVNAGTFKLGYQNRPSNRKEKNFVGGKNWKTQVEFQAEEPSVGQILLAD
ncbi:hypothetical protein AVEN_233451-1 [Araneus ventricosus]|uniref:Uncharacterized protein n=1 Tax=Araneus ventricosus TaxID=182803 RepID=A0A4Y2KZZ0_ARAVE|nr:hypothetical protein AVEN_233451-1 [Araneus ventricosus]